MAKFLLVLTLQTYGSEAQRRKRLLPPATLEYLRRTPEQRQGAMNLVFACQKEIDADADDADAGLTLVHMTLDAFAMENAARRGGLILFFQQLHSLMYSEAFLPCPRAVNVAQYLASAKSNATCLHACLHALATGRTTTSMVPVKREQWTLPMLATDCIFKVWNPQKTDTSMSFLATILDSCDPSVAATRFRQLGPGFEGAVPMCTVAKYIADGWLRVGAGAFLPPGLFLWNCR